MSRRRRSLLGDTGSIPVPTATESEPDSSASEEDSEDAAPETEPEAPASDEEAPPEDPEASESDDAPPAELGEDPSDRQNLANTMAVSASEADSILDAPAPPPLEPEEAAEAEEPAAEAEEPATPAAKMTPMNETPLPADFQGEDESDDDWFLRTGQPAPRRDEDVASLPNEDTGPVIVTKQTSPVVFAGAAVVIGGGLLVLVLVLVVGSFLI